MDILQLIEQAKGRINSEKNHFAGILSPQEAYLIWKNYPNALLIDVRTRVELDWVGFIPEAWHLEWQAYPQHTRNDRFIETLRGKVATDQLVMFICRSGGRSAQAATAATEQGWASCYNVEFGFEGDLNEAHHRGQKNGWRHSGLPWVQS